MKLLIATQNQGKIKELRALLEDSPFAVVGLDEFPPIAEPEETGATFLENAALKARYYALETGVLALSDDSGLEVEALGGAPGVYSARYAGTQATNAERNRKLIEELSHTGDAERRGRFVCAATIADRRGEVIFEAEGVCSGVIADVPRGENGFGYDPIFVPDGFEQTFGELSSAVKAEISHRSRALKKIIAFLRDFTTHELDQ